MRVNTFGKDEKNSIGRALLIGMGWMRVSAYLPFYWDRRLRTRPFMT